MTLSFYRFDSAASRVWAFSMMGLARPFMARITGLNFWKLCGSGTGQGFTPKPNTGVYAILAAWDDIASAQDALSEARVFAAYHRHAAENWTLFLAPVSVRGTWSGTSPFDVLEDIADAPLAALTRATLRPRNIVRFWGRVPQISDVIGQDRNVLFKIGLGEMPILRQITFSIWPDVDTMAAFARDPAGPHAKAIQAVRDGNWFRDELYARFRVVADQGNWAGAEPMNIPHLDRAA